MSRYILMYSMVFEVVIELFSDQQILGAMIKNLICQLSWYGMLVGNQSNLTRPSLQLIEFL